MKHNLIIYYYLKPGNIRTTKEYTLDKEIFTLLYIESVDVVKMNNINDVVERLLE